MSVLYYSDFSIKIVLVMIWIMKSYLRLFLSIRRVYKYLVAIDLEPSVDWRNVIYGSKIGTMGERIKQ